MGGGGVQNDWHISQEKIELHLDTCVSMNKMTVWVVLIQEMLRFILSTLCMTAEQIVSAEEIPIHNLKG